MKVTRWGHAALHLEAQRSSVIIDPGTLSDPGVFELTGLDAVIVTHQHPDHLDPERVTQLIGNNPQAAFLSDPQTAEKYGPPWRPHFAGDQTVFADLTITAVGQWHAKILPELPVVTNVGITVQGKSGLRLFHPGDSYEYAPKDIDVLAVPLTAPWAKVSETLEFVQRVQPRIAFPIHDCVVSEPGYGIYWGHLTNFGGVETLYRLGQTESVEL